MSGRMSRALPGGLVAAIALSAIVHAAVLVWLTDTLTRPGMEAASGFPSVEIVLDAPPREPAQPVAGAEAERAPASGRDAARAEPSATPSAETPAEAETAREVRPTETTSRTTREAEASAAAETEPASDAPTRKPAPAARAESETPSPAPAWTIDTEETASTPIESEESPVESAVPAASESADTPPAPAEAEPVDTVSLPRDEAPMPTPRPEPPAAQPERAAAEPQPSAPARSEPEPKEPEDGETETASRSAPANAGRQGGATAGEKASYARRLAGHVERHKRYPRAAERQSMTGAAGLSITIDRSGGLAGASLASASGHALLDEEALATARRAAPYPRPPEGIGDGTTTFTVTLRFSR